MKVKKIIGWGFTIVLAAILGILVTHPLDWLTDQFIILFPGLNAFIYANILLLLSACLLLMLFIMLPRTMFALSLITWLMLCPWPTVVFVLAITSIIIALERLLRRGETC